MNTDEKIENLETSVRELKAEVKALVDMFEKDGEKLPDYTPCNLHCTPEFWGNLARGHAGSGTTWDWWGGSILDKNELKAAIEAWENTEINSPAESFLSNLIADYWCSSGHEWEYVGID